ncbi:MAG: hypothetical protein RJB38_2447 [Pseudomonadota bacterium]|jgi:redox-sensitive bicupin YhaK (pirin superfamily)
MNQPQEIRPKVRLLAILSLGVTMMSLNLDFTAPSSLTVRPAAQLPQTNLSWLKIKDHFVATVGNHAGQGTPLGRLLVLADAELAPQSRFPDHPHQDMEILTWVIQGKLHHRDSKSSDQWVERHHLQLMSAREGIFHSEGNLSSETLRLFQIWIQPDSQGGAPLVTQTAIASGGFQLVAAPEGAPLPIRQELWVYVARFENQRFEISIPRSKIGYGISTGTLKWNERPLQDGDGTSLSSGTLSVEGTGAAMILIQNDETKRS